jgi:hypothetical protein
MQPLQLHPDATDPVLARQQERFNELVRDVALWRATLAEWNERIDRYHRAVDPLRRQLHAAWREWVFALDQASLQPGLSRAERGQLGALLKKAASALLEVGDDPAVAAVAARHGEPAALLTPAPDESDSAAGGEDHLEHMADDREREAAGAQREEWAAQRRAASAARRRKREEQQVSQTVRDAYRRLASALHPDRESDASARERKTALMQQANEARAERDLLGLLELQLQAEQMHRGALGSVNRSRLEHYVTVLQEQLGDLQSEVRRLEANFRARTGLAPGFGLQPRKAERAITAKAQRLRGDVLALRQQVRLILAGEDTGVWLREIRTG